MPKVSEFYGVGIYVFFKDHAPPHFHARRAGRWTRIEIGSLRVMSGGLPRRDLRRVREWASLHRSELLDDWDLACQRLPLRRIAPLE